MTATLAQLRARLPGLMLRDQRRLARRADRAGALRDAGARDRAVAELAAEVAAAEQRIQGAAARVPVISYPPSCRSASARTSWPRRSATTRS